MYKISIILPVYNVGDKLRDSFNSILNQSFGFENLEVIYVDDCSTDDSASIIKEFVDLYDNVKYYCLSENSGYAGKPRNVGIKHATADYLMFLDPDDVYLGNACEVLYDNISSSNLDFVSANYILNYKTKKSSPKWKKWFKINLINNKIEIKSIFDEPNLMLCPPSIWTKIIKKSFILDNNIDFPVGVPGQDFVFFIHSLLKADGIKFVDIPIVEYMPGDGNQNQSVTSKRNKKLLSGYIKSYFEAYNIIKDYETLIEYSVFHLQYWTKQLCFSTLEDVEKVNLLNFAYPLFEVYKTYRTQSYHSKDIQLFFEHVYEKNFIDAINLCEKIAINFKKYDDVLLNTIQNKHYIFICNNDDLNKEIFSLAKILNENGYDITLINFDDLKTFNNIDQFYDFDNVVNIFENFSKNSSIDSDSFKNYSYSKTNDGKFLLKDCLNDFEITFDNVYEFNNYFLTELWFKFNEKIFLIGQNLKKFDISSSSFYKIDLSNDAFDFLNVESADKLNHCEQIFMEIYLNDIKKEYDYQDKISNISKEVKELNSKNKELIKINEELNEELSSFKSRKIVKIVDKSRNLFK